LLLPELVQGQGLSQQAVVSACGRGVSRISRRLHLLSGLPDAALATVRGGTLSSWAANRVVAPSQGRRLRAIRRPLALTRNTVRRILHEPVGNVAATPP
jgi:hypothetical protein